DRMPELLAAADALIDSSVGITCLEALTCGCPVVVHGAPPGHSRESARTIARLGLAQLAETPAELADALRRACAGRRPDLGSFPSAASLITAARLRFEPPPAWRRRVVVATAAISG